MTLRKIDENMIDPNFVQKVDDSIAQLAETTPKIINTTMTQSEIQTAINTYKRLKFLAGIYPLTLTNGLGLTIPSNREIEFEEGAELKANGTDLSSYHIVRVQGVQNVKLVKPKIVGERATHIGTTGEWGFGIAVDNAKNITLIQPKCSDCWGDGIYLGDLNENITIDRPICDNNRRQGISVIACKTLTIIDPILKNTNGTNPQSGIDFEPNLGTSGLENIRLINPYTENNVGMGVLFTLAALSNTDKIIDITVENHKDVGSGNGLYIGACDNLKGAITINNPKWINNDFIALKARDYTSTAPLVHIKSPTIINPHRLTVVGELADPRYGSVISLYREGSDSIVNSLGGLVLDDISIQNTDINTYANIAVHDALTTKKVNNMFVRNPIRLGLSPRNVYSNVGVMKVKEYDIKNILSADVSVTGTDVIRHYTNLGATGLLKVTLQEATPIGCKVTIQIESAQSIELNPYLQSVEGLSASPQRISSNAIGSKLVIEKVTATLWTVVSKTGTWTVA